MTLDRWAVMLAVLAGEPAPAQSVTPGRVHRFAPDTGDDPGLADMRAAVIWRELARTGGCAA